MTNLRHPTPGEGGGPCSPAPPPRGHRSHSLDVEARQAVRSQARTTHWPLHRCFCQETRRGYSRPALSAAHEVPPGAGHLPPVSWALGIRSHTSPVSSPSLDWSSDPGLGSRARPTDLRVPAAVYDGAPQTGPRKGVQSKRAQSPVDSCRATGKLRLAEAWPAQNPPRSPQVPNQI